MLSSVPSFGISRWFSQHSLQHLRDTTRAMDNASGDDGIVLTVNPSWKPTIRSSITTDNKRDAFLLARGSSTQIYSMIKVVRNKWSRDALEINSQLGINSGEMTFSTFSR